MTTLMVDPISPQHSTYQTTIEMFSFNMKESTNANSSIHGVEHKCFTPMTILRTISTSTFQETAANAVVDLQANDDDHNINKIKNVDFSTFLQDWEAFCNKFAHSTTYALVHSSTTDLMSLPIVDNDDNNQTMNKWSTDQPSTTNSFNDSLCQLHHSVWELEKVNHQFAQFLDSLKTQAPCQPTLQDLANNLQQPQPGPIPQRDYTLQLIILLVLPPAPNPLASPIQHPAHQLDQIDCHPRLVPGAMPLVHHPAPKTVPCRLPWPPPTTMTTIPNWEKPAVLPPASNPITGMFCAGKPHWPPP